MTCRFCVCTISIAISVAYIISAYDGTSSKLGALGSCWAPWFCDGSAAVMADRRSDGSAWGPAPAAAAAAAGVPAAAASRQDCSALCGGALGARAVILNARCEENAGVACCCVAVPAAGVAVPVCCCACRWCCCACRCCCAALWCCCAAFWCCCAASRCCCACWCAHQPPRTVMGGSGGAQGSPGRAVGTSGRALGGSIYRQTPDQPHSGRYVISSSNKVTYHVYARVVVFQLLDMHMCTSTAHNIVNTVMPTLVCKMFSMQALG